MARVLILDDDWFQRAIVAEMLARAGFELCGAAHSSDEAMEMAKASPPDVIVAGVKLADDDGVAGAAAIRSACRCGLVFLGGFMSTATRERIRLAHASVVLTKPFTYSQMANAVRIAAKSSHAEYPAAGSAR